MSDPSVIGIVARAFRLLKELAPQSLDEDTENAAAAKQEIQTAIDFCLLRCDWSFASVLASLPQVDTATADPALPHAYRLPSDLIRLQHVIGDTVRFRIDADYLRADLPTVLPIRYTRRITDEKNMPADFQTAVSYHLASLLAPRVTGSASRAQALSDDAERNLMSAMKADARSASRQRHDGLDSSVDWVAQALAR